MSIKKKRKIVVVLSLITILVSIYYLDVVHWEWYLRIWRAKVSVNGKEVKNGRVYQSGEKVYVFYTDEKAASIHHLVYQNQGKIVKPNPNQGYWSPIFGVGSRPLEGIALNGTDSKAEFYDANLKTTPDKILFFAEHDVQVEVLLNN